MDEYSFINKEVKISLKNEWYYKGKVLSQGEDFLRIKDIKGRIVLICREEIKIIEEVNA